jgi:hypothetical protein
VLGLGDDGGSLKTMSIASCAWETIRPDAADKRPGLTLRIELGGHQKA